LTRALSPFEWWKLPLVGRLHSGPSFAKTLSDVACAFMRRGEEAGRCDTLLAKLKESEGRKLTHDMLVGNVKTLFLAGTDTTSGSLAFTFHRLAQQPRLQEMLASEVASKAGEGVTSIQHLQELHLVRAVWAETLRLHSVAPMLFFHNVEEMNLAGRMLPPCTEIIVLTRYVENTMPDIRAMGSDLKDFRPERWLSDGAFKQSRDPLAFGHGSRACLGKRLADLEGQLAIVEIMRHFSLSGGPARLGEITRFTQGPAQDVELSVMPRSTKLSDCSLVNSSLGGS